MTPIYASTQPNRMTMPATAHSIASPPRNKDDHGQSRRRVPGYIIPSKWPKLSSGKDSSDTSSSAGQLFGYPVGVGPYMPPERRVEADVLEPQDWNGDDVLFARPPRLPTTPLDPAQRAWKYQRLASIWRRQNERSLMPSSSDASNINETDECMVETTHSFEDTIPITTPIPYDIASSDGLNSPQELSTVDLLGIRRDFIRALSGLEGIMVAEEAEKEAVINEEDNSGDTDRPRVDMGGVSIPLGGVRESLIRASTTLYDDLKSRKKEFSCQRSPDTSIRCFCAAVTETYDEARVRSLLDAHVAELLTKEPQLLFSSTSPSILGIPGIRRTTPSLTCLCCVECGAWQDLLCAIYPSFVKKIPFKIDGSAKGKKANTVVYEPPSRNRLRGLVQNFRCFTCKVILIEPLVTVSSIEDMAIAGPIKHQSYDNVSPPETLDPAGAERSMVINDFDASTHGASAMAGRYCLRSALIGDIHEASGSMIYSTFPIRLSLLIDPSTEGCNATTKTLATYGEPPKFKKRRDFPTFILYSRGDVAKLSSLYPETSSKSNPIDSDTFIHGQSIKSTLKYSMKKLPYDPVEASRQNGSFLIVLTKSAPSCSETSLTTRGIVDAITRTSRLEYSLARRVALKRISEAVAEAGTDPDLVVMSGNHQVSLECPSTLARIRTPVRGTKCEHLQCFDLEFYIQSQSRIAAHNKRWSCTICDRCCYPHELVVDGMMEELLRINPNTKTVYFELNQGALITRCPHDGESIDDLADEIADIYGELPTVEIHEDRPIEDNEHTLQGSVDMIIDDGPYDDGLRRSLVRGGESVDDVIDLDQ